MRGRCGVHGHGPVRRVTRAGVMLPELESTAPRCLRRLQPAAARVVRPLHPACRSGPALSRRARGFRAARRARAPRRPRRSPRRSRPCRSRPPRQRPRASRRCRARRSTAPRSPRPCPRRARACGIHWASLNILRTVATMRAAFGSAASSRCFGYGIGTSSVQTRPIGASRS